MLNCRVIITTSDECFSLIIKYLSSLWDDNSTVFVSEEVSVNRSPSGFISSEKFFFSKAKESLSGGVDQIKTIVCSAGGLFVPVVGSGIGRRLVFSAGVSFDDCFKFLIAEEYVLVDFVVDPGEYSTRGGIIDVYPFSSVRPYRISFLDDVSSVSSFAVDTQLTTGKIKNFILSSVSKNMPVSLCDVSLNQFLPLNFNHNNELCVGFGKSPNHQICLDVLTHGQFLVQDKSLFRSITSLDGLSSIGVVDDKKNLFIPGWFIKKDGVSRGNNDVDGTFFSLQMSEIKRGDFLVHRDHGVGVCLGLVIKEDGVNIQEFLAIKYADGGVLKIDVGRLDLVGYFASSDTENIALDSLSKKGVWGRKKLSAKKRAEETVQHLLNLYIKRNDFFRLPFLNDDLLEKQFFSEFPYDDTPDQLRAWNEISSDLSSNSPMDRLLCGDVGFGKTELAIRAAFRAVLSKKRVVVLAPTTILAGQLYSSFSARLESNAVSVDLVSRFRSEKELSGIKKCVLEEKNDVLVGTHALLNDNIYINNIGLLIIDEEHRFGVKHKEKIKSFKAGVDVLSMSATPIPRSMNLALSGIYSISMLQTPPKLRLPINTRVEYFSDEIIKEAVDFEVGRGGQVFFVHNNITNIKNVVHRVRKLCSDLFVEFMHGQEPPSKIEKKMSLFVSGKIDVLVCSSIIESGIDVPNANCIIINNSHLFGLSQLYQIRGRVGRGALQAYAYLLVPRVMHLSEKAFKRIKTIDQNTRLGSGYNISISDMELRGSGSLFGYKQSGGGGSMGYEMYTRLIQRTIHESGNLESGFRVLPEDVEIELYPNRFIPESYISVESLRMSVYKNLFTVSNEKELDNILNSLVDRFGVAPASLINLVNESRLRLHAARVGVSSVLHRGCGVVCSVGGRDPVFYASSLIACAGRFFEEEKIVYHVLPSSVNNFSLCVHFTEKLDIYSIFSRFFDKFTALEKIN